MEERKETSSSTEDLKKEKNGTEQTKEGLEEETIIEEEILFSFDTEEDYVKLNDYFSPTRSTEVRYYIPKALVFISNFPLFSLFTLI